MVNSEYVFELDTHTQETQCLSYTRTEYSAQYGNWLFNGDSKQGTTFTRLWVDTTDSSLHKSSQGFVLVCESECVCVCV